MVSFALLNVCLQSRSTVLHHILYIPEPCAPASSPIGHDGSRVVLDRTSPMSTTSTAAAGQAGDDDVEEGNDAGDDGLQDGSDAIHDGHEASADGLQDGPEL